MKAEDTSGDVRRRIFHQTDGLADGKKTSGIRLAIESGIGRDEVESYRIEEHLNMKYVVERLRVRYFSTQAGRKSNSSGNAGNVNKKRRRYRIA